MKEYRAINGVMLPACDDPLALPKGNDGDFFYLVKGTEDLPTGIYRVNGDGTYTHNGTLPFSLRASLTEVDKVSVKVERIEKEGSKISEEKISKQEESLADLKETVRKLQTVESSKEPDFEDPYWSTWIRLENDYSTLKQKISVWVRSPSNNALIFPNSWSTEVKVPTAAEAVPDPNVPILKRVTLPQNVTFRFEDVLREDAISSDVSFAAGVFTDIAFQLLDVNDVVIPRTTRIHRPSSKDTAAGLGWNPVSTLARTAEYSFYYQNGGKLVFTHPIKF